MKKSQVVRDAFRYLSQAELDKIREKSAGKHIIVNIGAGAGTSGLALREGAGNDADITTIDISEGGPLGGLMNEINAFRKTGLRIPRHVLADSGEYGHSWNMGMIDLIFIDGDHSKNGITRDIAAWTRHVRQGGIILFHDYGSNDWPFVKNTVDEMAEKSNYRIIEIADTLAVAIKLEE